MRRLAALHVVALAALALASPARAEDAREAARKIMHDALAERAAMPVRSPLMPERAAADAARARQQAATVRAGPATGPHGAGIQGAKDARTWRTDAANRAAAGAAMTRGAPGTMQWGTSSSGWGWYSCGDAAGMMRSTGQNPQGGMMSGGGMTACPMCGGGGMGGMPGHR